MTLDDGTLLLVLCCAGLRLLSPYLVPGTTLRAFIIIMMANAPMALSEGPTVSVAMWINPFTPSGVGTTVFSMRPRGGSMCKSSWRS